MIFTFQEINGTKKVIFFATSRMEAEKELHVRYGGNRDNYSLISFVSAEKFNLIYH